MWGKNKDKPKIEFLSSIEYLKDIEEIKPDLASKFIPSWWKDFPYDNSVDKNKFRPLSLTAKRCPSFPDYFSSGYILPMWADTVLFFNSKTQEWKWQCGNLMHPKFQIDYISPDRFKDYGKTSFHNKDIVAAWHFVNPWTIVTPPGYYLLQLPLFFHENSDFAVFPGIYDAHMVNTDKLEVALYAADKEVFIKRGTPLVQYILVKKEPFDLIVRDKTEKDIKFEQKKATLKSTSFGIIYNKLKGKDYPTNS